MKLVALIETPRRMDDAVSALAVATRSTLAECRTRLAPEPPALLARLEDASADALVASLRSAGLAVLAIDARVPTDAARTVAHRIGFFPEAVAFTPRAGEAMELPWDDVVVVLRGTRESRSVTERAEKSTSVSLGMALATGGLKMTRTTTKTFHSTETAIQQVILVYARDGRAALLAEGLVDFSCLGAELQPSSTANMATLARKLRERAPRAFSDDRLLRLGRRPLPMVGGGESQSATGATVVTTRDTASSLDVLAEILHRGLTLGTLP